MILSDYDIATRCNPPRIQLHETGKEARAMISPFTAPAIREHEGKKLISYGLSSYGYDVRIGNMFKVFTNVHSAVVDPKNFSPKNFVDITTDDPIAIPPNSFALCNSFEYMVIPRDVLAICLGKSTYARCGIVVNVTPLEPEWEGHITIEVSNTTPNPALIYPNEGICQLIFLQHDKGCLTSYNDRKGKYQGQTGITLPTV